MRASKQLLLGLCIFTLLFMVTPGARATEFDQKVIATFNGPVQIPGQVLSSGTYVFKVLDVIGTRDVIQVSNADESHVLATAIAVPRYRSNPSDPTVFLFEERGSSAPQAIQAWFYPGRVAGHQFIYAAAVAPEPAAADTTPAPPPNEVAAATPAPAVIPDEPVNDQPVAEPTAQNTQTTDQATAPAASTDQTTNELPKTASTTPLIALVGMLLLGGAFGLKILAARVS